jgi:photosystem II stability/assembly factor-like uncharacterized protein
MHSTRTFALAAVSLTALAVAAGPGLAAPTAPSVKYSTATISGLGIRNIGSAVMSGRIAAIAARTEADGRTLVLIGAASGGVWKSKDGGTTFTPMFDKQPVQSIGTIALDPNHPDTYWVGTGEPWTRNSVSIGDGVYKTTDGGETWTNVGLPKSERVAKILVDPSNSDVVYACVAGALWSDSPDRGLYRTADGGKSWTQVLKGPNLSTGCASISIDPKNPGKLFAAMWDFRRTGWNFRSGGTGPDAPSGSGLFVSENGGSSWTKLDPKANKGFPSGSLGRIGVTIAPSNPKIVYALIESARSALFRSDDGGVTWEERDRSQSMVWRPFYFANLTIDPKNPDRVFKGDLSLIASDDGGKSFSNVNGGTHGDHHQLWIDPTNTSHVMTGDDGGLWTSWDGGNRWIKSENLPISQFYHVSVDDKDPYQVYGGLQDNTAWVADSAYPGGVTNSRWENFLGGDGFFAYADPSDPEHYLYAETQGGSIGRVNRQTLETRDVQPRPDKLEKLRFNWNTPIALSPNEKGTIYIGAQYLYRTRDHGQTWDRISPDLTTNDPNKQKQEESGGVTVDNSAAEMHTTIYSISESPLKAGLIWIGTDDGNLQLTRDGGGAWSNLTKNVPGLPASSWVSWVEAGRFNEGTAYATFDRHTFGDFKPHVYRTTDYGRTWTSLVGEGSGVRGYAHVIKEDLKAPNLLYLGTEFGLYISVDGGGHWAAFKGRDFPSVAVRDIAIQPRDNDLVLATHGRGIWIIDDITPLRSLTPELMAKTLAILPSRPIQQRQENFGGWNGGDAVFTGENPAGGAVITYYQPTRALIGKLKIEVLDADGHVLDTPSASKRPGINRVSWNMRAPAPRAPSAAQLAFNASQGPRLPPGDYTVRITKGDQVFTSKITIVLDRRATFDLASRKEEFVAAQRAGGLFNRMSALVDRINAVRQGADARAGAAKDPALKTELTALTGKADVLRKEIVATKEGGAITGEERLREHLDSLYGAINGYEGRPSAYQMAYLKVLEDQLADLNQRFDKLAAGDLVKVNADLAKAGQTPIALPPAMAANTDAGGDRAASGLAGWRFSLRDVRAVAGEAVAERD